MKNNMIKKVCICITASVLILGMLTGCGSNKSEAASESFTSDYYNAGEWEEAATEDYGAEDYVAEYKSPNAVQAEEVTESQATKTDRKLIRTVTINVETQDFDGLTSQIASKVNALGGYIESSSVDGTSETTYRTRSANYTLRIPREKADEFIEKIESQSNVSHHSESQEDVTLTYTDIKSRKDALQVEYDRLEQLLNGADTVEELIYIEERLAEVRYEIGSIESQLRTYDNKVDYTTIYLYIDEVKDYTEPVPQPDEMTLWQKMCKGFMSSVKAVKIILEGLLLFIVSSIPVLLLLAIIITIIVVIVKTCKKKSSKRKAEKVGKNPISSRPGSYTAMIDEKQTVEKEVGNTEESTEEDTEDKNE